MAARLKIRVLGGGLYGAHLTLSLLRAGHDVELHESQSFLMMGASGNMPARLHLGFHYPRSRLTRVACQDHYAKFMATYGHLTRGVPTNIYAVADRLSMVDFGNYVQSLENEVEFVKIAKPEEFGLRNVEGAVLTGERHLIIREARTWFSAQLKDVARFGVKATDHREADFDLTIDCTFCAQENAGVDRYEPCVSAQLRGPTDKAVTIMDGPFPSLYPWDPVEGLCSLTSAKHTPLTKDCTTYGEAREILDTLSPKAFHVRCDAMVDQMREYYPGIANYSVIGYMRAIRAMPLSGADARLVDVVRISRKTLRIRASKLDAIFYAEDIVKEAIRSL